MRYHLRRTDREITEEIALKRLLNNANYVVLAMVHEGEPYVVPLNHVYDEEENVLFFHCASEGKKLTYMRENPRVWGLAVLDLGFGEGQCINLYASVMFAGKVSFVEGLEEKLQVLRLLSMKIHDNPELALERLEKLADTDVFTGMVVGRIELEEITGKRSTEMTVEKIIQLTS